MPSSRRLRLWRFALLVGPLVAALWAGAGAVSSASPNGTPTASASTPTVSSVAPSSTTPASTVKATAVAGGAATVQASATTAGPAPAGPGATGSPSSTPPTAPSASPSSTPPSVLTPTITATTQATATTPATATIQATASPTRTAVPGELAADPALVQEVATWLATPRHLPPSAPSGARESALSDCASGSVNFSVTHGWCYVAQLKLFYNTTDTTFIDPRTGQIFTYDSTQKAFLAVTQEVDELPGAPPVLRRPPGAAPPISKQCTAQQSQVVSTHIQGLNQNASRTDSAQMKALFGLQARWWQSLCSGS